MNIFNNIYLFKLKIYFVYFRDISGITLLAVPAEVYMVGSSYGYSVVAKAMMCVVLGYVYLPVFDKLKINSSFEYLRLRYDNRVCVAGSAIFFFTFVAFMPIVIFIPAIAFSQGKYNYHFYYYYLFEAKLSKDLIFVKSV